MLKKLLRILCWFTALVVLVPGLYVWVIGFLPVQHTPLMELRYAEKKGDPGFHIQHTWVDYASISDQMKLAVLCSEDPNFAKHHGFDYKAIELARKYNATHEKKRGASTISQQTAKNVFLWSGRNYFRKGCEAYFTVLMECTWSKKRILEVYLNSIEMGDGIFGVEAAAQHYFHCSAAKLTPYQAALIAVSLPNPRKMNPARPGNYMTARTAWLVSYMRKYKHLLADIES